MKNGVVGIVLLLSVVYCCNTLLAQPPSFFTKSYRNIGVLPSGDSVTALCLDVKPYVISGYRYDEKKDFIYLDLKLLSGNGNRVKKDQYICYDIAAEQLIWERSFNSKGKHPFFGDSTVAWNEPMELVIYKPLVPGSLKEVAGWNIVYHNIDNHVFITYDGTAIDDRTSEVIWTTKIKARYGWQDIYTTTTDSLIILAEGLKGVDLKTGESWYHELKTGADRYGAMIATNAVGVTALMFGGVGVFSTGPDRIAGMSSGIVVDKGYYYVAGAEEVIRVSSSGNLEWRSLLPQKRTGSSEVWIDDTRVYVLNKGFVIKNDAYTPAAKPYIAAYNKSDGSLIYSKELDEGKIVLSSIVQGSRAYIIITNKIQAIDLENGNIVNTKVRKDELLQYKQFIQKDNIVFLDDKDGVWPYAHKFDEDELLIADTESNEYIRLDQELQESGTLRSSDYLIKTEHDGYTLYYGDDAVLVESGHTIVAKLKPIAAPARKDGKIFMAVSSEAIYFYSID